MFKKETYYFVLIILITLTSCSFHSRQDDTFDLAIQDLEAIKEKGKITVLTDYSSTDYFIYKGQPLGFQYEMLQQLANHLSVRLEVRVSRSLNESFELLRSGKARPDRTKPHCNNRQKGFCKFHSSPHAGLPGSGAKKTGKLEKNEPEGNTVLPYHNQGRS